MGRAIRKTSDASEWLKQQGMEFLLWGTCGLSGGALCDAMEKYARFVTRRKATKNPKSAQPKSQKPQRAGRG